MNFSKWFKHKRFFSLSLRQTLIFGAGVSILLPALVFAYFQLSAKFEHEINLRVRVPMAQYAEVLSQGLAVVIWNVDRAVGGQLVDAVMRNPDVVRIQVRNEFGDVFVEKGIAQAEGQHLLRVEREIVYSGARVGHLSLEMSTASVEKALWNDFLRLGLALAAQVLISFVFIWLLFDRRMLKPLRQLQEQTLRLARGELEQPVKQMRKDEIGTLALGLDVMRIDLAALIAELDKNNKTLNNELHERKRAEAALGLSQAKFGAIFDASPIPMTVSRLGEAYRLLDINNAWIRLFGVENSTRLGTEAETRLLWQDPKDRQTIFAELERTRELANYRAWMLRGGDQAAILCEISGKVISLGDETLLILVYDDITAKHQYDLDILQLNARLEHRVLERTQELSEALAQLTEAQAELVQKEKLSALGALVAGIAHELNTPIGNSLTVASTLQSGANEFAAAIEGGLTRSRLTAFLNDSREGADILVRCLRQAAKLVASFKQVAVDQSSVNRRAFVLDEMVAELLITLGPSFRNCSHSVTNTIPSGITLDSYPGPLGQIVTNLINNAVIHAFEQDQKGIIEIAAERLGADKVLLTVNDNGMGIPEAHLSRIFDPFFTTKLGQGGSGLGLNIVYNLVRDILGGTIRVESTLGQGTRFVLTLPLIAPAPPPEKPIEVSSSLH